MRRFLVSAVLAILPVAALGVPCVNGLYIGPSWLTKTKSHADFAALVKRLREARVGNVYINASGISSESEIAKSFIKNLANALPETKVIGMVVRIPVCSQTASKEKCFDPSSEVAQKDLNTDIKGIWNLGFDGLQFDFETVASGDRWFLEILARAKATKPAKKMISVAAYTLELAEKEKREWVPKVLPAGKGDQTLLTWSRAYYSEVLARADQVMVMNYDTALRTAKDYSRFTQWQTGELKKLAAEAKVDLQIGLPSDMRGREGLYDRAAENLTNGVSGVRDAMANRGCGDGLAGVTIFNDASMNPKLWSTFNAAFAESGADESKRSAPVSR